METIKMELEIFYWFITSSWYYVNFQYYIEMGLQRKYAYLKAKQ